MKRKALASSLRRIAVYVDEPEPGWFAWALIEADEGASIWAQIERADEWVAATRKRWLTGLLVLQQMIDDLDIGPRDEPPVAAKKPKGSPFGFGFGTNLT